MKKDNETNPELGNDKKKGSRSDEMIKSSREERNKNLGEMFDQQAQKGERRPEPEPEPEPESKGEAREDIEKKLDEVQAKGLEEPEEAKPEKKDDVLSEGDFNFDQIEKKAEVEKAEDDDKGGGEKIKDEEVISDGGSEEVSRLKRSVNTMRDQLSERGREAKEAKAQLQEKDMEVERIQKENDRLQSELQSPQRKAEDPFRDPSIKAAQDQLIEQRDMVASGLTGDEREFFRQNFEGMLRQYADARNSESTEMRDRLTDELRQKLGKELDPQDARDVMKLLAANSSQYADLHSRIQGFSEEASKLDEANSVKEWKKIESLTKATIKEISEVDDEVIAADPSSPASYVASKVSKDPDYARRSLQVMDVVNEAFNGKRPITSEEMKRIKDNEEVGGMKADAFLKERGRDAEKRRAEVMKRSYLAMMLLPDIPDILKELDLLKGKQDSKEREKEALLEKGRDPGSNKGSEEEKGEDKASERPSGVHRVLEAMG